MTLIQGLFDSTVKLFNSEEKQMHRLHLWIDTILLVLPTVMLFSSEKLKNRRDTYCFSAVKTNR